MYSLIVISLSITARLFNQKHKIPRKGNENNDTCKQKAKKMSKMQVKIT